jgi:hypothetical protein
MAADVSKTISIDTRATEESGFSYTVPVREVARLSGVDRSTAVASMLDGSALPGWLKFDRSSLTFTATRIPRGSLPLVVKINFTARGGVKHSIRATIRK